jgi:RND family efflux transporter MFP subunit
MFKRLAKDRKVQIGILVLFIILFFVFFSTGESEVESAVMTFTTVKQGDLPIFLVESGEIEAVYYSDIKAPMEWRMELQIIDMAEEAKSVKKGDFLLRFDTSTLEDQLDLAKDRLASALADKEKLLAQQAWEIKQLEIERDLAEYSREIAELQVELLKYEADVQRQDAELDRRKALIQVEKAKTNIESKRIIHSAQLNNTELRILKARADLKELRGKIESLTLYSPRDGMVVYNAIGGWNSRHKAAIGDKARPGETVIQIPDLTTMQVKLIVNEMDALRMAVGQNAIIRLDAYPEHTFSGKIVEIAKLAQTEHEETVKFFHVIVRIDQSDPLLKPGMTARAKIHLQTLKDIIYVPVTAIFESNGEAIVFRRDDMDSPVEVKTAKRNDQFVQILSGDIHPGDELITSSPALAVRRFGYADFATAVLKDPPYFSAAFDSMQQLGLAFNYEQGRLKPVDSGRDSVSEDVQVERFKGRFRKMSIPGNDDSVRRQRATRSKQSDRVQISIDSSKTKSR